MQDKNENIEKELLLELEWILVNHRYKCSKIESINSSNYTYMYRIKKALNKSKVEEKRVAVLRKTINSVNNKIEKGMLFKEIFEPLPAIIVDELKNYSKNTQKQGQGNMMENIVKNEAQRNKEEKRIEKIKYISKIVDTILLDLNNLDRTELLKLESKYKDNIDNNTKNYGIPKAKGEILGSLYCGIIENTRKNFEKLLFDDYRIKLKSTDKLSDKMSDELLRYELAGLIYTDAMCKGRITKIRPNNNSNIEYKAYNSLKNDVLFLGKVVREKYQNNYSISPKEELIENYIGGQMTFEGLMSKRDKVVRKRNLK